MTQRKIANKCPACGWQSLFIGSGGWLTCGNLDCASPIIELRTIPSVQPNEPDKAIDEIFAEPVMTYDTEDGKMFFSSDAIKSKVKALLAQQSQAAVEAYKKELISKLEHKDEQGTQVGKGWNIAIDSVKAIIKEES